MTEHECTFPEIKARDLDHLGVKDGALILAPCSCGQTPFDELDEARHQRIEASRALATAQPHRPIYHWTPSKHRRQITRYGLRPGRRAVTHPAPSAVEDPSREGAELRRWRAPWVCFADDPGWAWMLSGGQASAPSGEWDLWMTTIDRLDPATIEPLPSLDTNTRVHEYRVTERVFKRDLFYVGSRVKP